MKKRAAILLGFVGFFCVIVAAFPEIPQMKPSRLAKKLPVEFGDWSGRQEEPGAREKEVLAKDTEFERMNYVDRSGTKPPVQVSVVFSGKNLSQSIHRPEVCLRAQGWTFVSEKHLVFSGLLPGGQDLPAKEMVCKMQYFQKDDNGDPKPVMLNSGEPAYIWRVFYYTFFGHEKIVSGHYQRTKEDIKDRLLKGYDQRWAYATFATFITKKHHDQGLHRGSVGIMNQEETKAYIEKFLGELLPLVVSPPGEGYDESLVEGRDLGS